MPKTLLFFALNLLCLTAFTQDISGVWAGGGDYKPDDALGQMLTSVGGEKRLTIHINPNGEITGTLSATYDRAKATIANDAVDITFIVTGNYDSAKNLLLLVVTHLKASDDTAAHKAMKWKDSVFYNTTMLLQDGKMEIGGKMSQTLNKNIAGEWAASSRASARGLVISNSLNMHFLPAALRLEKVMSSGQTVLSPPPQPQTSPGVEKRKTDIQHTITLDTSLVTLDMYDNGEVDGDIATLILDGRIIADKQLLSTKAVSVTLNLDRDKPEHLLELYANNLGSIPPNTALLVITCKRKRYEINLSSNTGLNGTVRLVVNPK